MRSVFRLVLLCLTALALPLQGLAATGAMHCAAMHERMQVSAANDHDDGAAHHHEGHASKSAVSAADDHRGDDGSPRTGGAFKCSACAACCVALGLPSGAVTLPQAPAESLDPPIALRATVAFLTGGPERPPRAVLA